MKKSFLAKIRECSTSFFFFFFAILTLQAISSFFTFTSVRTWYPTLVKASWSPPPYVFAPVWTVLYIMIALAGWLVFIEKGKAKQKRRALIFYGIQLIFNFIWSFLFFYLQSPLLGLLDIIALLSALILTMHAFYRINPLAGWLLLPYFLWTLYALTLAVVLWRFN